MRLIVAEKPSVARDIARVAGAKEKLNTKKIAAYKNAEYVITSARGHFVTLSDPDDYDEKLSKWRVADLPIFPQTFKLKPIKDCEAELRELGNLMNNRDVTEIIIATDAGREGELIFRHIYNFSGCKKPCKRLWISSLTDESIRGGLSNLLDGADKENLYQSAITRAEVDWLVGMNLSRLYSILFHGRYSVGRVQTALLNIIVGRDNEIANFKKTIFYALYLENGAEWFKNNDGETITRFDSKEAAEAVKLACLGKAATVTSAATKQKSENRPLLYSLTSLQKDANEKHGFSAARTLVAAQSLYEKKLVTYPRTDSNFLTEDMRGVCVKLAETLAFYDEKQVKKLFGQGLTVDNRIIDDAKVSDHHAIIPTTDIAKMGKMELTPDEQSILDMVIRRFLTALDKPYIYSESEYIFTIKIDGGQFHTFALTTKTPVFMGWRGYDNEDKDSENEKENVPSYKQGELYPVKDLTLLERQTQPPKPFRESTLLSAMENISRRVDNNLKEFVKERGLGTPATRAAIIERLLSLNLIERTKSKNIVSTQTGRELISRLPETVKSVEMTAEMESRLADIEQGKISPDSAITEIQKFVSGVIDYEKTRTHTAINPAGERPQAEVIGVCPKCGGNVAERKQGWFCDNQSCFFAIWKSEKFWTDRKKKLTTAMVKKLLKDGKIHVKGLRSEKSGKEYEADVSFDEWTGKDGKKRVGFKMSFDKK
jgi:DNA topoisomerase-3